ncbi:sulfotransferase [Vibrio sp. TH_r3]|uniref:sulfotransferase family protein n=1 Tax=Vibrio sp. TH_r3 TaxID=3082084 RepID=UPI002955A3C8|nr:sulfotransferase [Vibrio sp. TH_r3]MDV7102907.1 sulfotransferase [Vibrio sp. TH_r3]
MIHQLIKSPQIIFPKEHIFLISHMRANTSLFGHLLGSSDEISGYYEMHIGYYSWKSLIRQQLIYKQQHENSKPTRFYFDKLLHNEHDLRKTIMDKSNCKFIFMLRNPARTIQSTCNLYQKVEPEHEFATVEGAANYYLERVEHIGAMLNQFDDFSRCYYLDAEALISSTEDTLESLSTWLGLRQPLSPEYKKFELTGSKKHGDSSSYINQGKVRASRESYNNIELPEELIQQCDEKYRLVRDGMINKCTMLSLDTPNGGT